MPEKSNDRKLALPGEATPREGGFHTGGGDPRPLLRGRGRVIPYATSFATESLDELLRGVG